MVRDIILVLLNVRSSHNVGSLFRTADGAGVGKIILSGYTPTPTDRFGRVNKEIAKTALGAEKFIPWEVVSPRTLIKKLHDLGMTIVAVEQSPKSVDYRKIKPPEKIAVILGNEVTGIPQSILKSVDAVAEIPMRGNMVRQAHHSRHTGTGKESLNVSSAGAIVLFEWN